MMRESEGSGKHFGDKGLDSFAEGYFVQYHKGISDSDVHPNWRLEQFAPREEMEIP